MQNNQRPSKTKFSILLFFLTTNIYGQQNLDIERVNSGRGEFFIDVLKFIPQDLDSTLTREILFFDSARQDYGVISAKVSSRTKVLPENGRLIHGTWLQVNRYTNDTIAIGQFQNGLPVGTYYEYQEGKTNPPTTIRKYENGLIVYKWYYDRSNVYDRNKKYIYETFYPPCKECLYNFGGYTEHTKGKVVKTLDPATMKVIKIQEF